MVETRELCLFFILFFLLELASPPGARAPECPAFQGRITQGQKSEAGPPSPPPLPVMCCLCVRAGKHLLLREPRGWMGGERRVEVSVAERSGE